MRRRARTNRDWRLPLLAAAASLVAMLVQQAIRTGWQVRTLPERVMESLLVLIPLDLFERGLQQFGANAKDIALVGTYVGMAALLFACAWYTLRFRNPWFCLLLGASLWLVAMLLVLPLTGAGAFANSLLTSPALTDA